MGIFKKFGEMVNSAGQAGIGAVKSVLDLPREAAAFGEGLGESAGKKFGQFIQPAVQKILPENTRANVNKFTQSAQGSLQAGTEGGNFSRPINQAQKVGFAAGQIAQLATPAGEAKGAMLASKAAKALGASERVAMLASKIGSLSLSSLFQGGVSAVQSGDVKTGATTAAANMIGTPLIHGAGKLAGAIAKTISSGLSGVPVATIEKAFRDPDVVRKAITESTMQGENALEAVMSKVDTAFKDLKNARSENYLANLKKAAEAEPIIISLAGTKKKLAESFGKFNINLKEGLVDASQSKLPSKFQKTLQGVVDELNAWSDTSPLGMDTLITRLQNLATEGSSKGEAQFNKILGEVTGDLNKYVNKKAPLVGKLRSEYADQSKVIDRITDELFNGKESMTSRKLANIFNPKNTLHKSIVSELGDKTGKDLLADIAGVVLSKATPEGLGKYLTSIIGTGTVAAAFSNPATLAALPGLAAASSPRLVGEAAMAAGKLAPAAAKAVKGITGIAGKALGRPGGASQSLEQPQEQPGATSLESRYPQFQEQIKAAREQGITDEELQQYLQENGL